MFSTPQDSTSELQQYNYFVTQEPVSEEKIEVPVFTHVYEENGVLYCASSTSEGVYYYTYALNNPLRFIDPSGYTYNKPSDLKREYYNFYDHYTWVDGTVCSGWVRNEALYNVDFHTFFDDLAADYNGDDFCLSLEYQ